MQVILLEKIVKLGELGEQVVVKAGYARNYLIPQKKAVPATADNIQLFETQRAEFQQVADARIKEATARAQRIESISVTLTVKAGEEGKLFGSVGVKDIAEAAAEMGVDISKAEVRMPLGPIRELGDFEIAVHLNSEVDATLKVSVVPQ